MTTDIIVTYSATENLYTLKITPEQYQALRKTLHFATVIAEKLNHVLNTKQALLESAYVAHEKHQDIEREILGLSKTLDEFWFYSQQITPLILRS